MPVPDNIIVKQLDMELHGGCNYKCPMCPQADGREKDFLKKLPFDVFTKIVDDALQYGLDTVSLHGSGEPTLNRDMPKFVAYVKEKGVKCISFTNGYRLTEDISRELIGAGIDVLRISCIGYDRAHSAMAFLFDRGGYPCIISIPFNFISRHKWCYFLCVYCWYCVHFGFLLWLLFLLYLMSLLVVHFGFLFIVPFE